MQKKKKTSRDLNMTTRSEVYEGVGLFLTDIVLETLLFLFLFFIFFICCEYCTRVFILVGYSVIHSMYSLLT